VTDATFLTKSRAPTVDFLVHDETIKFTKYHTSDIPAWNYFGLIKSASNYIYRIGLVDDGASMSLVQTKFSYATHTSTAQITLLAGIPSGSCMCTFLSDIYVASGNIVKRYSYSSDVLTLQATSLAGALGTGTARAIAYGDFEGLYVYMIDTKVVGGVSATFGKVTLLEGVSLTSRGNWKGQVPCPGGTNPQLFCTDKTLFFQNSKLSSGPVMFEFNLDTNGALAAVLPLDSLDDTETFTLTGAYLISSNDPIVTGVVVRKNGSKMLVYMIGNTSTQIGHNEFTTGKNYFIDTYTGEGPGKLDYAFGNLWYICQNDAWSGNLTYYLTLDAFDPAALVTSAPLTGVDNVQVQMSSNTPYSLALKGKALDLNLSGGLKNIAPGKELWMRLNSGGVTVTLPFVVASVGRVLDVNGTSSQITAYSKWMSMLAEWESDSFYDYWSQSKADGAAIDLTKMVPSSGTWTSTDVLYLKDLNVSGILYSTERATPGNYIRAHFVRNPSDYNAKVGLVVNFMQETIADAAKRLPAGTVVTQDMCLTKGIVISHDGSNVNVYHYRKDSKSGEVYTLLSTHSLVIERGYWYWLGAKFVNGYLTVSYAVSPSDDFYRWEFINLFSEIVVFPSGFEWNNDYGRVGIYGMNSTITGKCLPLQSESGVVALVDNSMFPASETVQIDSEQFTYTGKSQNVTSGEVMFALGDPKYGWSSFGAGNIDLSRDKTTTVIWQRPYIGNSPIYINAVSVNITKVGNPIDGIELSIVDPGASYGILGSKKASCVKLASEIYNGGGWVTFKFRSRVQVNVGDVIQIMKSQKAAGCDGINYYVISGTASGGYQFGASLFNDNTDTWSGANTGFWHTLYSDPISDPSMPSICVLYDAGNLVETTNYYVNQALVVTSGPGEGTCVKITGSQKVEDGLMIFYVDRDVSSVLDTSSFMKVYPSLYGLTRNNPTAHTNEKIDVYRDGTMLSINEFACFSDELDLSLEDMVRKIARHAGVTKFVGKKLIDPNLLIDYTTGSPAIQKRFMTFEMTFQGAVDQIDCHFWMDTPTPSPTDFKLRIGSNTVSYYSGTTLVSSAPGVGVGFRSTVRISLFNNYLSIWKDTEYIHTFVINPNDLARTGTYFKVTEPGNLQLYLNVPDACVRVDNYALDMGKTALSLIQQLIGNRRFYLQDSAGGLTLFRTRTCQNNTDTPYDRAISGTVSDVEPPFTRVMLEGGEIVEAYEKDDIQKYGNIFHRETINEIFTLQDAQDFATMYLNEADASVRPVQFTGAIMPSLMPNDTLIVKFPASDPAVGTQLSEVIIDGISYQINLTNQAAVFDMNVTGRVK
jgi:hypothetical protein